MRKSKISKYIILTAFLDAAVLSMLTPACKKEQSISSTPAITFDSILPNPATQNHDTLRIVITYKDGDGDLGQDSTTTKNLFITDSRTDSVTGLTIPQLLPGNATTAIEGNMTIILPPPYLINSSDSSETAIYSVYVVDRAGHQSNTVKTTPLVINR